MREGPRKQTDHQAINFALWGKDELSGKHIGRERHAIVARASRSRSKHIGRVSSRALNSRSEQSKSKDFLNLIFQFVHSCDNYRTVIFGQLILFFF